MPLDTNLPCSSLRRAAMARDASLDKDPLCVCNSSSFWKRCFGELAPDWEILTPPLPRWWKLEANMKGVGRGGGGWGPAWAIPFPYTTYLWSASVYVWANWTRRFPEDWRYIMEQPGTACHLLSVWAVMCKNRVFTFKGMGIGLLVRDFGCI